MFYNHQQTIPSYLFISGHKKTRERRNMQANNGKCNWNFCKSHFSARQKKRAKCKQYKINGDTQKILLKGGKPHASRKRGECGERRVTVSADAQNYKTECGAYEAGVKELRPSCAEASSEAAKCFWQVERSPGAQHLWVQFEANGKKDLWEKSEKAYPWSQRYRYA